MLLKEIKFLKKGEKSLCFVPDSFQVFEAGGSLKRTIEEYPDIEDLEKEFSPEEVRLNLDILKKNRLLFHSEKPLKPTINEDKLWEKCVLLCDEKGEFILTFSFLKKLLRFLKSINCFNITLKSSDPQRLISLARSIPSKFKIAILIDKLPSDAVLLGVSKKRNMVLVFEPQNYCDKSVRMLKELRNRIGKWKLIPVLNITGGFEEDIELLEKYNIEEIWLNYWCSCCKGGLEGFEFSEEYLPRFSNLYLLQRDILGGRRRSYGCGAGISSFTVTSNGSIWACESVLGDNSFLLGNFLSGVVHFRKGEERKNCSGCWTRYLCGGGSNLLMVNDLEKVCANYIAYLEKAIIDLASYDHIKKRWVIFIGDQLQWVFGDRYSRGDLPEFNKMPEKMRVKGNSMLPVLETGDTVFLKPFADRDLKLGDIICFDKPPSSHRVVMIKGREVYEKGDNLPYGTWIDKKVIVGKVFKVEKSDGKEIEMSGVFMGFVNRYRAMKSLLTGKFFRIRKVLGGFFNGL